MIYLVENIQLLVFIKSNKNTIRYLAMAKWAILCAIDSYQIVGSPPRDFEHPPLAPLKGCVQDVKEVRNILINRWDFQPSNVLSLTSPSLPPLTQQEMTAWGKADTSPTYENIIWAIKWLQRQANPGDVVYIHFSGYTDMCPPYLPHMRKLDIVDRVLVPMNTIQDGKPLRDIELAVLLKSLISCDMEVTLIVDGRPHRGSIEYKNHESTFTKEELMKVSHGSWSRAGWNTWLQNPEPHEPLCVFWLHDGTLADPEATSEYYDSESQHWNGLLTHQLIRVLHNSHPATTTYTSLRDELVGLLNEWLRLNVHPFTRSIFTNASVNQLFLGGGQSSTIKRPIFPAHFIETIPLPELQIMGGYSHGLQTGQRFILIDENDAELLHFRRRIVLGSFKLATVEESTSVAWPLHLFDDVVANYLSTNRLFAMCISSPTRKARRPSIVLEAKKGEISADNYAHSTLDPGRETISEYSQSLSPDIQASLYAYYLQLGDTTSRFARGLRVSVVGGYSYDENDLSRVPSFDKQKKINMITGNFAVIQISSLQTGPLYVLVFCFDSAFGVNKVYPLGHKDRPKEDFKSNLLGWERILHLRLSMPSVRLRDDTIDSVTECIKIVASDMPMSSSILDLPPISDQSFLQRHNDPARSNYVQDPPIGHSEKIVGAQMEAERRFGSIFTEDLDDNQNWAVYTIPFILHKPQKTESLGS